jgi:hypothetical protein
MTDHTELVRDHISDGSPLPAIPLIISKSIVLRDRADLPAVRSERPNVRLRFVWRGGAHEPMFVFQNCREPSWERVDITAEKPLEAAFVMERTRHGPGVIPSTMHLWRDVRVFGHGIMERGFWHRRRDTDENNEHARFDSVSVYGYTDCGWLIEGKQSKEHLFTHCRANGDSTGRAGIRAFGSFQWIGGAMSGNSEACFVLGPPCDVVRIEGVGCETSARLLTSQGPTGAAYPVLLEQVRFMTDRLHPDGVMIDFRSPGPLTIRGGQFGNGKQPVPTIRVRTVADVAFNCECAAFDARGTHERAAHVFDIPQNTRRDVRISANLYADAHGMARRR